jgi:hypothetical protein
VHSHTTITQDELAGQLDQTEQQAPEDNEIENSLDASESQQDESNGPEKKVEQQEPKDDTVEDSSDSSESQQDESSDTEQTESQEQVAEDDIVEDSIDSSESQQDDSTETEEAEVEQRGLEGDVSSENIEQPVQDEMSEKKESDSTEQKEPVAEVQEEEIFGIDTVDINEPEGNWLFKRIWWEKSKELFGKIRDRVDKIVESRMHFFTERVKLDRNVLDPFYVNIGLNQGALRESISHLLEILKSEREQDGILEPDELEMFNTLIEEKSVLEKVNESVMSIQQLDASLDEALNKLMEQINLARSYERESWQLLNGIAEELNDKKAREHYYTIATLWRNVKEIANYIEGPFAQHFIKLASLSIENVQSISEAVAALEEKGIEIKKRVEPKKDIADQSDDEDESYDEQPKQEIGWSTWLWQKVTEWFSW